MRKTRKQTGKRKGKRPLTDWNLFVMKIKKENPKLSFKEVLRKASKDRNTKKNKKTMP